MKKIIIFIVVLVSFFKGNAQEKEHAAFLKQQHVGKLNPEQYHNALVLLLSKTYDEKTSFFRKGAKELIVLHIKKTFPKESVVDVVNNTEYLPPPKNFKESIMVSMIHKETNSESFSFREERVGEFMGAYKGIPYTSTNCGNNLIPLYKIKENESEDLSPYKVDTVFVEEKPEINRVVVVKKEDKTSKTAIGGTEGLPSDTTWTKVLSEDGKNIFISTTLKNENTFPAGVGGNQQPNIILLRGDEGGNNKTVVKKGNGLLWAITGAAVTAAILFATKDKWYRPPTTTPVPPPPPVTPDPNTPPDFQGPTYPNGWRLGFAFRISF